MNDAAVAELFIAALENGTAPWIRPWDASMPDGLRPFNPTTGKMYKGINSLVLGAQGFEDPRWLTYKQSTELGAQVRRGARSVHITYWQYEKEQRDPATGLMRTVKLDKPRPFSAFVFNATDHIDGLPSYQKPAIRWDPLVRADELVEASGVYVAERSGDTAMYSPWLDQITMPFRHQFARASGWASTLLHEFSHATGHVSRLGRDQTGTFASESYAREELIAEIGSYMLCTELAVSTPGLDTQHASYVGSWIKALKSDPKEIFRAAAAAQRVFNFAMEFDRSPQLREAQEEARKIQPVHQAEPVSTERKAPRRRKGTPEHAQEMSR